jgi:exodeoxyribonuclease-3
LAGDYNVAPTDLDIYPTKSWTKDALVQPAPRATFASLIANGWTDALRDVFDDERVYTFWTYGEIAMKRIMVSGSTTSCSAKRSLPV